MSVREDLHKLVDQLPDDAAQDVLQYARFVLTLEAAPEDDEPLTDEDLAALSEAEQDIKAGRVTPHEEVKARFKAGL